ncbi:MAG: FHA domain-containing protein [Chloroflexota bacterium]
MSDQPQQPPSDKPEPDRDEQITRRSRPPETAILSTPPGFGRRQTISRARSGSFAFQNQREIILVIRGIVERLVVPEDKPLVLGRSDARTGSTPDIDLTPYGALDRGVSRRHCRLYISEDVLYITDLNSTNGTYLSSARLEPHQPTPLRKGDDLMLGRLPMQVLFR